MSALKFEEVKKTYENGVRALNGLSMEVPRGAVFGFIGLNGAGKTTALRILAGLASADEGSISIFDEPLNHAVIARRKLMGFVLDEPLYFDWMEVGEYLEWVGVMYDLSPEDAKLRADELIGFFDLNEKAGSHIGACSTGMKKKVSLAAAVIHRPKLLVLDEPLEGIDAVAGSAIKESLRLMAESGTTVLITSHVLETVEKLCDEIAILHRGAIVLQSKTAELSAASTRGAESLEELFVELVSERQHHKRLSWL